MISNFLLGYIKLCLERCILCAVYTYCFLRTHPIILMGFKGALRTRRLKESMVFFFLMRNWLCPAWACTGYMTIWPADLRSRLNSTTSRSWGAGKILDSLSFGFLTGNNHICLTKLLWGSNKMMYVEGYYKLVSHYKHLNLKSLLIKRKGKKFQLRKRTRMHLLRHLKVTVKWSSGFWIEKQIL